MKTIISLITLMISYLVLNVFFQSIFEYRVSDSYTGPCVIFLYDTEMKTNKNYLEIKNALNYASQKNLKMEFVFESLESDKEIEIIPIGSKVEDKNRYIFQLTNGKQTSTCTNDEIQSITFYVGTQADLSAWYKYNMSETEYFESKGIDWCKYYIENIPR